MTAHKVRYFAVLGIYTLLVTLFTVGCLSFLYLTLFHPSIPIENIRVSNVSENSISLSWVSHQSMKIRVYYSQHPIPLTARIVLRFLPKNLSARLFDLQSVGDDFGPIAATIHHVTLKNLEPETNYHYLISSGLRFYTKDIQGEPLPEVKTAGLLESAPFPYPCYGTVIDFADEMPDSPVLVYVSTEGSSLISAFTNSAGNYSLDLSSLRIEDFSALFDLSQKETLVLEAEGGLWGKASQPLYRDSCQPIGLLRLE